MKKYRFGIIGCGVIYQVHARAINALEDAELVAIADVVEEKARDAALNRSYGANPDIYTDYRKMLERDDIDIVSICTPSGMHADMACDCMEAGKHVIVEKPMDVTLKACDKFIETWKRTGKYATVISQHRFSEDVQRLKKAIDEGWFGKIALIDSYTKWYRSHEYYKSGDWRATWELDGGGALMNQSVHYVDLMQWMVGDVESLYGNCANVWHDIVVEDTAVATIRFKDGTIGSLEGTTAANPGLKQELHVMGEFGTVSIVESRIKVWKFVNRDTEIEQAVSTQDGSGGSSDPASINRDLHTRQYRDFLDAINAGTSPLITPVEARKPVEIILAVYESSRTGQPVKLPLDPETTFVGTRF
ncbi:MAG: Gfo/Idh/MocA family oxidoreductase [Bacillota bacterium]|nr:Gfo/Idh/MocA family oxidoreductase [Bacillota bacterium]HOB91519.1 Gfo/Idh/MocA family oxidoreductase [Bacillota bacterium]HPZ54673.1 Gfo/Idh/MocA family oxidoreductase [Bacillota bacterium]HQD19106.1 Gfo/Idh/MocA family oxidoreductase [Bacillota bacterium]